MNRTTRRHVVAAALALAVAAAGTVGVMRLAGAAPPAGYKCGKGGRKNVARERCDCPRGKRPSRNGAGEAVCKPRRRGDPVAIDESPSVAAVPVSVGGVDAGTGAPGTAESQAKEEPPIAEADRDDVKRCVGTCLSKGAECLEAAAKVAALDPEAEGECKRSYEGCKQGCPAEVKAARERAERARLEEAEFAKLRQANDERRSACKTTRCPTAETQCRVAQNAEWVQCRRDERKDACAWTGHSYGGWRSQLDCLKVVCGNLDPELLEHRQRCEAAANVCRSNCDLDFRDVDGDGIRDAEDRCPYDKGPVSSLGCPAKQ